VSRDGNRPSKEQRKGQRRFGGFDQKIIAIYAQGMTVREIQRFLEEQYKVEVSANLISTVTDSVLEDVVECQNRPLESMYPVVSFDALRSKFATKARSRTRPSTWRLASGVTAPSMCSRLWIQQTEGAKFWLAVMNELKNRGAQDLLIAVIDGLKGFP
jgi:putative transposase